MNFEEHSIEPVKHDLAFLFNRHSRESGNPAVKDSLCWPDRPSEALTSRNRDRKRHIRVNRDVTAS
ncbi:MAG TPA: hypothetical protein VLS27_16905, partial [Gammaproteobacteria bacterium]|nr:hypothetical protein [Gammaproteobacteria bacterium]